LSVESALAEAEALVSPGEVDACELTVALGSERVAGLILEEALIFGGLPALAIDAEGAARAVPGLAAVVATLVDPTVAVVVYAVTVFVGLRVDVGGVVVAIAALAREATRSRATLPSGARRAEAVSVEIFEKNHQDALIDALVAVVVEPVTGLCGAGVDLRVAVVAVQGARAPGACGEAVPVKVQAALARLTLSVLAEGALGADLFIVALAVLAAHADDAVAGALALERFARHYHWRLG
jgi:hypothetical protein